MSLELEDDDNPSEPPSLDRRKEKRIKSSNTNHLFIPIIQQNDEQIRIEQPTSLQSEHESEGIGELIPQNNIHTRAQSQGNKLSSNLDESNLYSSLKSSERKSDSLNSSDQKNDQHEELTQIQEFDENKNLENIDLGEKEDSNSEEFEERSQIERGVFHRNSLLKQ